MLTYYLRTDRRTYGRKGIVVHRNISKQRNKINFDPKIASERTRFWLL